MSRFAAMILCIAIALSAAAACGETADPLFASFEGMEWYFSSGVGAWATEMRILADGSFSGEFHDSEMGENADAYPEGTIYLCSFTGTMSLVAQTGENTWKVRIDTLVPDASQAAESIDDGIRYVKAEPYGLSAGDEMTLYRPGTPVSEIPEEMLIWTHAMDLENRPDALERWFLSSEKNESGFVAYRADPVVGLPNPWSDMSAAELLEASGLSFGVPEGAENVIYRFLGSEHLAEMQFTLDGDEYCARIRPAALEDGELMEISGMYFAWDHEEEVTVHHCRGIIGIAQCGTEDWAERCLWYDAAPGLMCCLSVSTTDPDGLDLTAVAEQVYIPVQGDA